MLGGESETFVAAYRVTQQGSFEGKNILELVGDMDQRPALVEARRKLFEAREKRVHPGHDDVQLARPRQLPSNTADPVDCIAIIGDPDSAETPGLLSVERDG